MRYNKIQIISLAINYLGHDAVSGLESKIAESALQRYNINFESMIGNSDYWYAKKWAQLTKNDVTPVSDRWQYEYELPSDYIQAIRLEPQVDYDLFYERVLWTNASSLKLEYVFRPEPEDLTAAHVDFLSLSIASDLAISVLENASLAQEIKARKKEARMLATSLSGRAKPNSFVLNSRYINARY